MKFVTSRLILIFAIFFSTQYAFPNSYTLAVLDFQNNSFFNAEAYATLSKGLADMMISEMDQVQSIHVVERQKLKSLLDELKLSQTGMVSEKSTVEVGKLVGAKHLIFGSYLVTMDDKIRIDLRIVEVETGLTVKSGEVTGKTKEILTLIKKLSKKILKDLNVRLTNVESRVLDESTSLDIKAVLSFSQGVAYEDSKEWEKAKKSYMNALKIEPDFPQAKMRINRLSEMDSKRE